MYISEDVFGVFVLLVIVAVVVVLSFAEKRKYHSDRMHKAVSVLYRRRKQLKQTKHKE